MEIFIVGMILIALFHFIYDGILLPSIHLDLRFRLFALRDELRDLKMQYRDSIDDEVYQIIQSSINNAVNILPQINVSMLIKTQKLVEIDKNLKEKIRKNDRKIEECAVKECKVIRQKSLRCLTYAFFANGGAWFLYLIPIFYTLFVVKKLTLTMKELIVIPENDINKKLLKDVGAVLA